MALSDRETRGGSEGLVAPSMLIFDLEAVSDGRQTRPCPKSAELVRSLQVLATSQTHFEARLHWDVSYYKQRLLKEEGSLDTVVLATHLAAVGYKVAVRTAVGGGVGQECFQNLHYEFLLVTEGSSVTEYIVDPRFREQFQISHTTEAYQEFLRHVPEEYVGTAARLRPMVKLLCLQMQEAFEATGLTCPPWRRGASMISKWVPAKAKDREVASPSSSPEAQPRRSLSGLSPRGPLSRSNSAATNCSTASSAHTSLSRRSSGVSVAAKPLMRQSGFQLRTSFESGITSVPESMAVDLSLDTRRRSLNPVPPKTSAFKENCSSSRRSGSLPSGVGAPVKLAGRSTLPQPPIQEHEWQAPRIHTVKLGGDRAR